MKGRVNMAIDVVEEAVSALPGDMVLQEISHANQSSINTRETSLIPSPLARSTSASDSHSR